MNEYDKKFEKGMRDYVEMTYDWDKEKEVLDTMQQCQRNYDYEKCFNFLEDIREVISSSDLVILFKLKRYKRSLSKRYIHKSINP